MATVEQNPSISVGIGRNSSVREATRPIREGVAVFLDRKFPWITADMITAFGLACNLGGAVFSARENNPNHTEETLLWELAPDMLLITGAIADAFDGPKAEIEKEKRRKRDPYYKEDDKGQLKDAMADRIGTLAKGLSRAISAYQRGDKVGEYMAYANVVTSFFSSITRARAESRLLEVPENGSDPLEFVGNHVGRTILDTISTSRPILRQRFNIQRMLDVVSTIGTLKVADARLKNGKPVDREKFKEKYEKKLGRAVTEEEVTVALLKVRTDAIKRGKAMSIVAMISIVAVAVTHETLRGRNPLFSSNEGEQVTVFQRQGSR